MGTNTAFERLQARIEIADALIAALIENHPDPVSVRAAWRDVTASSVAKQTLNAVASGHSSVYREQTHASIVVWENVLAGICARSPGAGT